MPTSIVKQQDRNTHKRSDILKRQTGASLGFHSSSNYIMVLIKKRLFVFPTALLIQRQTSARNTVYRAINSPSNGCSYLCRAVNISVCC